MLLPLQGRRLYYDIAGPENAPVVCITHSLASDGGSWAEQLPPLLQAGFRVLRLDMRGHGGSDPVAGDYTMQALAGDVAAALDALAIPRVHYIGLSIGGMIGQAFAIEHGAKLISAMWCDTLPASPAGAAALWDERMNTVRRANSLEPLADAHGGALVHRRLQGKQPGALEADPRHRRGDDASRLSRLLGGDHELRFHRQAFRRCASRCWWCAAPRMPAPRRAKTAASPGSSRARATRRSPACATSRMSKRPTRSTGSCCAGSISSAAPAEPARPPP